MIDESSLFLSNKELITKVKPSKELIQEILTIFSMPTLISSPIITSDQILIRDILSNIQIEDFFTSAAIVLNFQACLFIQVDDNTSLSEVLRKMISFGFFAPQIYQCKDFSNELQSIIIYLKKYLSNSTLNIPQCSAATSFLLSSISPYVSQIHLFTNLEGLKNILDIYLTKKVINEHFVPQFFEFFLAVFLTLTLDATLQPVEFDILSTLIKCIASTLVTKISIEFDYSSLMKKSLECISNHFLSIPIRVELLNLLNSLCVTYPDASTILNEVSHLEQIATFISDYLKSLPNEYVLKKRDLPINLNTKDVQQQFLNPIKIGQNEVRPFTYESRKEVNIVTGIQEPDPSEFNQKFKQISTLMQLISNLCRSIKNEKVSLTHLNILKCFLRHECARIPSGIFFVSLWATNIAKMEQTSSAIELHKYNFYQYALEQAFFQYDDHLLSNFMTSLLLWISAKSMKSLFLLKDIINVFQTSAITVRLSSDLCDFFIKSSKIGLTNFFQAITETKFSQLIINDLAFYMQNCQNLDKSNRTKEESERLVNNYFLLLRFVLDLTNDIDIFKKIFSSIRYYQIVLLHFLCSTTVDFAYLMSIRLLNSLTDSKSDILIEIFRFFHTRLFKSTNLTSAIINRVIEFCSAGFEKVGKQIGQIFIENHTFDVLVNLTITLNLQESIESLMDLFVKITTSKDCLYTPNIELFLKLKSLSKQTDSLSDFLLKVAFNDDLKMTQKRKIVNIGPLSLLFQLFKEDPEKLTEYLKFVHDCCEYSMIELCQTTFPIQLIMLLRKYRDKKEKDELFDLILNFLTEIMTISISQSDLIAFFQLFSWTKENKRPFFTSNLLTALIECFTHHENTPKSFFSLNNSNDSIELPLIQPDILNLGFSIDIKLQIFDRCGHIIHFESSDKSEFIDVSFTKDHFLSINGQPFDEKTLDTGKWITISFSFNKAELSFKCNELTINRKYVDKFTKPLSNNFICHNMKANVEFIVFQYGNKNKVSTLFEFHAASVYESKAIYKDQFANVKGAIFRLPPSLLEVFSSIGGIRLLLPILRQIANVKVNYNEDTTDTEQNPQDQTVTENNTNNNELSEIPKDESHLTPLSDEIQNQSNLNRSNEVQNQSNSNQSNEIQNQSNSNQSNGIQNQSNLNQSNEIQNQSNSNQSNGIENQSNSNQSNGIENQSNSNQSNEIQNQSNLNEIKNDEIELNSVDFLEKNNILELVLRLIAVIFQLSEQEQKDFSSIDGFKVISQLFSSISFDYFDQSVFNQIVNIMDSITYKTLLNQMIEFLLFDLVGIPTARTLFFNTFFQKVTQMVVKKPIDYSFLNCRNLLFILYNIEMTDKNYKLSHLRDKFFDFIFAISHQYLQSIDFRTIIFFCLYSENTLFQRKTINLFTKLIKKHEADLNANKPLIPIEQFIELLKDSKEKRNMDVFLLINQILFAKDYLKTQQKRHIIIQTILAVNPKSFPVNPNIKLQIPFSLYFLTINFDLNAFKKLTKSISNSEFVDNENFFIIFLLHFFLIEEKHNVFDDLLKETMTLWRNKDNPFLHLHQFVEQLEFQTQSDYSSFLRRIYMQSIFIDFPPSSFEKIMNTIFRFLFEIPSVDSFTQMFARQIKPNSFTFSEFLTFLENEFDCQHNFSSRRDNSEWVDFDIAHLFCEHLFSEINNNYQTQSTLILEELAYIIGNGLSCKIFYEHAQKLIQLIKTLKNPRIDTETNLSISRRNSIIILLGYIARRILQSNFNQHQDDVLPLIDIFNSALSELSTEISIIFKTKEKPDFYLVEFIKKLTLIEYEYQNYLLNNVDSYSTETSPLFAQKRLIHHTFDHDQSKFIQINSEQYNLLLQNYITTYKKSKLHSMKQFKQLFLEMNSENGPWMTPENPPIINYKLSNNTKRSMLIPNSKFKDHKDASLARDLGSYKNAQAELMKIAKMKMKTFQNGFNLIDFDLEEEEDLQNYKNKSKSNQNDSVHNKNESKELMICQSQLVTPKLLYSDGELTLTKTAIIFNSKLKWVKIKLNKIKSIFLRRYLLVDTAIEVFTRYSKSYFINFMNQQERLQFLNKITSLKIQSIKFIQKKFDDIKILVKTLTKKYHKSQISTYEYLLKLNIYAGRSFNDLSQYPVFPWILSNYTSTQIDLNDFSNYRDLSKPIGAINESRLAVIKERMNEGIGAETQYLYGALYSSPAVVIGYLIRMEPFTSLHVQLQSNRFDVADRLFYSIRTAYESVTTAQQDFRELIPEFFILPDFLENKNNFDLGVLASGIRVSDVQLPKWCKNARHFIELNKTALESNYVKSNIHQWIDLMFGPKSRGEKAIEADNVFSPTHYETSIENATEEDIIFCKEWAACFGCACLQIFDETPEPFVLIQKPPNDNNQFNLKLNSLIDKGFGLQNKPIKILETNKTDILAVTSDLTFISNETKVKLFCEIPSIFNNVFPFVSINKTRYVAIGLLWSSEVHFYQMKNLPFYVQSNTPNSNLITSIDLSENFLSIAFKDCTLRVFKLKFNDEQPINETKQVGFLSKHSVPISIICISESVGAVYSLSNDGYLSSISLDNKGRFLKGVNVGFSDPSLMCVSKSGFVSICFNGPDYSHLYVLDQNLEFISEMNYDLVIDCWTNAEKCGTEYLIVGHKSGEIACFKLPYLDSIWNHQIEHRITALAYQKNPMPKLIIGTSAGNILSIDVHNE